MATIFTAAFFYFWFGVLSLISSYSAVKKAYEKEKVGYGSKTIWFSLLFGITASVVFGFILGFQPTQIGEMSWFWIGIASIFVSRYFIKNKKSKKKEIKN